MTLSGQDCTALHNAIMGVLAEGKNPDDALAQAAKAVKPQ